MSEAPHAQDLLGIRVHDRDGERIGRVGDVYVDDSSHRADWVTVRSGPLGMRENFAPLHGAVLSRGRLLLGFSKRQVRTAPSVDVEHGHLSNRDGHRLYEHYGVDNAEVPPPRIPESRPAAGPRARDSHARSRSCPPEAMTTPGQEHFPVPGSSPESARSGAATPPEQHHARSRTPPPEPTPDRAGDSLRDNDDRDG
ncbi:PRC-barrel domain-containing protein [Actinopolyspora saharensis]|uniref:PRC-barrel domain-containing protein n=1 Tax=Actinopolyspora saharensis TaxID=995062 RepID=A0A1H1EQG5_9ACTN|nr:PRC-barrel domain-containing protein [Actinopolyspora saharensis]SDQ90991.1 PRC-barrel domain-containing protein [Actinopolyspora saharensis]